MGEVLWEAKVDSRRYMELGSLVSMGMVGFRKAETWYQHLIMSTLPLGAVVVIKDHRARMVSRNPNP